MAQDTETTKKWEKIFSKILSEVMDRIPGLIEEYGPKLWTKIKEYFDKKNIAILGRSGSGKDSFLARLRGRSIPLIHVNTRDPEPTPKFKVNYDTGHGETISFYVKEGMNVGGEPEHVEQYWDVACEGADIIFYLIDANILVNEINSASIGLDETDIDTYLQKVPLLKAFAEDMYLFTDPLAKKADSKLTIILNKIDLPLKNVPGDNHDDKIHNYARELQHLLRTIKNIAHHSLGNHRTQLTGVMPLSCKDPEIFTNLFPAILQNVAGA